MPGSANWFPVKTIDEVFHDLSPEQKSFLKSQIGIDDDDDLKAHILTIQAKAYKDYPYPCIQRFRFLRPKLSQLSAYSQVIKLGQERKGAIFLDIGCGFGNEIRKLVADGYPIENIVASDLCPDLWNSGHELFRSNRATFPVAFVPGDVLDPSHLASDLPHFDDPPNTPPPSLPDLVSLNSLQGHVSAIYAGSFFHLFDEEKQCQIARGLASLLSPLPGSVILGGQLALVKERNYPTERRNIFCHSPESWARLWDGTVFKEGTITVDGRLAPIPELTATDVSLHFLYWSITKK